MKWFFMSRKQLFFSVILLLSVNFFIVPESFYLVKIISFFLIVYGLFQFLSKKHENTSESDETELLDQQPIQKTTSEISDFIGIIQKIMSFDGAFYFEYESNSDLFTLKESSYSNAQVDLSHQISKGNPIFDELKESKTEVLITEIQDASILSFYKSFKTFRKEVLAIPVHTEGVLTGAFCFDSTEQYTFSDEIVSILHQMIRFFIEHETSASFTNQSQHNIPIEFDHIYVSFLKDCFVANTESEFLETLKHFIPRLFTASNFYITKQVSDTEAQIVILLGSTEGITRYEPFPLNEGIVGWSLSENKFVSLDRLVHNKQYTVRFHGNEKKPERIKSFMFMPLSSKPKIGLGFESNEENAFSNEQKRLLKDLASDLTFIYEIICKREHIVAESIYGPHQLAYNFKLFKDIFHNQKSLQMRNETPFQCILLKIEKVQLKSNDYRDILYKYVYKELKKSLRPSDFIFNYNFTSFVMLLSATTTDGAKHIKKRLEQMNNSRILISNNYIEPEISIELIENTHEKTVDDIKFKLHLS